MAERLGVLLPGQSNALSGDDPANPDPGPFPTGKRWRTTGGGAFVPFDNDTGVKDLALVRALEAGGRLNPIIFNVAVGGTSSAAWTPPSGDQYVAMQAQLGTMLTALPAELAGQPIRWVHVMDQGEYEVTNADGSLAAAWQSNYLKHCNAVEAQVGRRMIHIIVATKLPQSPNTNGAVVRAQQESAAGNPIFIIYRDDLTYPDGAHPTYADRAVLGARIGAKILELVGAETVGTLTGASRTALVNHVRNKQAYSPAATHYFHLKIGSSYVSQSGTGYAPLAVTNNATLWPNASGRVKSNGVALVWASPTIGGPNWGSIDGVEVTDSATPGAGTILASDTFTPVAIGPTAHTNGGDTGPYSIAIGQFTITAGAITTLGGFVDSVMHSLFNLMFGAVSYTAPTTTHGSYWAGNPAASGSQASPSRVSLTQASVWGTAPAGTGIAPSATDVALAHQVTGDWWAEHDAPTSGSLFFCAPRPGTAGGGGTIFAGQLQTQIL